MIEDLVFRLMGLMGLSEGLWVVNAFGISNDMSRRKTMLTKHEANENDMHVHFSITNGFLFVASTKHSFIGNAVKNVFTNVERYHDKKFEFTKKG